MRFMEVLTKLVVGMGKAGDHLLRKKFSGIIVAALAFACGATLVHALRVEPRTGRDGAYAATPIPCDTLAATLAPAAAATIAEDVEEFDTPGLEAWKNRHSGTPLPLAYDAETPNWRRPEEKVVALPSGRILALAGGDLYMFGEDRRVVWTRDTPHDVIYFTHIEATGIVYSTDDGNNLSILDAATGRELRGVPRGGRNFYGAMIPYGEDTCLIMEERGAYRAGYGGGDEPTQDGVTAWRGTKMLWEADVPPDAELQVVGSRIYAVTRTKNRILVREIKVPKGQR